jgi:hypothetical protein
MASINDKRVANQLLGTNNFVNDKTIVKTNSVSKIVTEDGKMRVKVGNRN